MDQNSPAPYPSHPAVHPSQVFRQEWVLSRQLIHAGGLTVEVSSVPPDSIDFPPLTHHTLCLMLSQGSRQVTRFNGREFDGAQQRGDFWLMPAGLSSFFHWESTDESLMFIIDPTFLHHIAAETNCVNPEKVELLDFTYRRDLQIEAIARSFYQEMQQDNIGGRLYTESLAHLLAIHLLRQYCAFKPVLKQYQGGLSQHSLQQVLDYIHTHLEQVISLSKLANTAGVSKYYFIKLFKRSMGITPHQYLIQQRVEQAKRLLKRSDLPINEIALQCGFTGQSHLTKTFQDASSVTPKAYRQQM